MPSVCLYFQIHQPYRIRKYTYFDIGNNNNYFDDQKNKDILNKVSEKCYLPANEILTHLIKKSEGKFKICLSFSGIVLEQFETYRPDVLKSFQKLVSTGAVELLTETYAHSLSCIFSESEFIRQVEKHKQYIKRLFNKTPKIFRNTELIYQNKIGKFAEEHGFDGILCEGAERFLGNKNPNHIYHPPETNHIKLLLKNYRLSDDIAFRFSDKDSGLFPLTAEKFSGWLHKMNGNAEVINLFMDYETFGEHQWQETGIFEFLMQLPDLVLEHPEFDFKTPSECISEYPSKGIYDVPEYMSWADTERDLSAWMSNELQVEALRKIYSVEEKISKTKNPELKKQFEYFQTSDHFYYMCTKFWNDGDVHKYFSPYDSPYEAYIHFMNAFSDFNARLNEKISTTAYSDKSNKKEISYPSAGSSYATN